MVPVDGGTSFVRLDVVPVDGGTSFVRLDVVPVDGGTSFVRLDVVPVDGGTSFVRLDVVPVDERTSFVRLDGGTSFVRLDVVPVDGGTIVLGGWVPVRGRVLLGWMWYHRWWPSFCYAGMCTVYGGNSFLLGWYGTIYGNCFVRLGSGYQ